MTSSERGALDVSWADEPQSVVAAIAHLREVLLPQATLVRISLPEVKQQECDEYNEHVPKWKLLSGSVVDLLDVRRARALCHASSLGCCCSAAAPCASPELFLSASRARSDCMCLCGRMMRRRSSYSTTKRSRFVALSRGGAASSLFMREARQPAAAARRSSSRSSRAPACNRAPACIIWWACCTLSFVHHHRARTYGLYTQYDATFLRAAR